jgi:hypothetical protein
MPIQEPALYEMVSPNITLCVVASRSGRPPDPPGAKDVWMLLLPPASCSVRTLLLWTASYCKFDCDESIAKAPSVLPTLATLQAPFFPTPQAPVTSVAQALDPGSHCRQAAF